MVVFACVIHPEQLRTPKVLDLSKFANRTLCSDVWCVAKSARFRPTVLLLFDMTMSQVETQIELQLVIARLHVRAQLVERLVVLGFPQVR